MDEARADPKSYWSLFADIWGDSENIFEDRALWTNLIRSGDQVERHTHIMEDAERAHLEALPDDIAIWRGADHAAILDGLSWTTSRLRAEWFARRLRRPRRAPRVARAMVRKEHVIAYFSGRSEDEIVVLPEHVIGATVTKLASVDK